MAAFSATKKPCLQGVRHDHANSLMSSLANLTFEAWERVGIRVKDRKQINSSVSATSLMQQCWGIEQGAKHNFEERGLQNPLSTQTVESSFTSRYLLEHPLLRNMNTYTTSSASNVVKSACRRYKETDVLCSFKRQQSCFFRKYGKDAALAASKSTIFPTHVRFCTPYCMGNIHNCQLRDLAFPPLLLDNTMLYTLICTDTLVTNLPQ